MSLDRPFAETAAIRSERWRNFRFVGTEPFRRGSSLRCRRGPARSCRSARSRRAMFARCSPAWRSSDTRRWRGPGRAFEPLRRDRRKRLLELRTGDGRPLGPHLKAQIERELDRLELLLEQVKTVEDARDRLLARLAESRTQDPTAPAETQPSPVALLMSLKGVVPEFAASLWTEGLRRSFAIRRQACAYPGLTPTPWRSGRSSTSRACRRPASAAANENAAIGLAVAAASTRNRRWRSGLIALSGITGTAARAGARRSPPVALSRARLRSPRRIFGARPSSTALCRVRKSLCGSHR